MIHALVPLLADAGIPMIALTLPLMLMLLIPVIVIEGVLCKKWLGLKNWETMKSNAVSNLVSTLIGIPLAWAIMLGLQFGAMASVDQRSHFLDSNSPLATAVAFFLHSAWIPPAEGSNVWWIPAAILVLLVPFFFASYGIEYFVMAYMIGMPSGGPENLAYPRIRTAVRNANLVTYGAMFIAASIWLFYLWATFIPPTIVDFRPTDFQVKADKGFFYSIGDELKYSDEFNPQAQNLLRGEVRGFQVSPDNSKLAVVANGHLLVVGPQRPTVREVAPVDSIYRDPKPMGQYFYRDENFQWSEDSRYLYLVRDRYYEPKGSQLFSINGELWRYDVQTGDLHLVLKPFPAYTYFFGRNGGIYFSGPTESGDLQLKYFDGIRVTHVGRPNTSSIRHDQLSANPVESPFFSFSIVDYQKTVIAEKEVELVIDQQDGSEKLQIAKKPYLAFARGGGRKEALYCADISSSVFLPGDRYFLFNASCKNYEGQLLVDTETGNYQKLPQKTRVYPVMNTTTDRHYRISSGGILPN
jgi:hypothetical protein